MTRGPNRERRYKRPLARERGIVPSSLPAAERRARCKACAAITVRKLLRFNYCPECWK